MAIFRTYTNILYKFILTLAVVAFGVNLKAQVLESKETLSRIVIDPGHGGKAVGAVGKYYYEKDIVLGVALRFGRLIEDYFPNIEVLYTRKTDVAIDLIDRSNIANDSNADLFISIHANSVDNNSTARGSEVYVLGPKRADDNLKVAQTENKAITLEENYETKYEGFEPDSPESYMIFQLMQNAHLEQSLKLAEFIQEELKFGPIKIARGVKQDAFVVLWHTTVPSVLVELGFISNVNEEMILGDPDMQDIMAERLFIAFKKYKDSFETSRGITEY